MLLYAWQQVTNGQDFVTICLSFLQFMHLIARWDKKSGLSNKLKIDCRIQGYIGLNAVLVVQ